VPRCLAHVAEQASDAFDAELKRISADGAVDARGVVISADLLARLLGTLPRKDDRPTFTAARFDGATFQGLAMFGGATFKDRVGFEEARFRREAWFGGARFEGGAGFGGARFEGGAGFSGARFEGEASFNAARFEGEAGFDGARFEGVAMFGVATFHGSAWFHEASFRRMAWFNETSFQASAIFNLTSFQGEAWFAGSSFQDEAQFDRASFQGETWFGGVRFQGEAWCAGASFEHPTQVGPLLARRLVLDSAVFRARVQLDATAATLCARRARFPVGVHLRLRYATVDLDDANLAAPAILAGVPLPFPELEDQEDQVTRAWQRLPPGPRQQRWRPRLVSVRRADVAGLRLADVDLRACRFAGAHNLDRLRIEGAPLFAHTTGWWRARRKTLAEEQHWRAGRPGRWRAAGWYPRACQPPASRMVEEPAEAPVVLEPARLAALYRELRKGREDAKDEPGAADFYYGECEMRRHDLGTPRAERLVMWAYWLLSGYALRAWRALAALVVVVVLAGVALAFWGFPDATPSFRPAAVGRGGALVYQQQPSEPAAGLGRLPGAIRFSARSATALLRGPDRALTPLGEWLEIGLRFAGPLLLGLAVLSVRGRVRR